MILRLVAALGLYWSVFVPAWAQPEALNEILERSTPPAGVVFELVESDRTALEHLIPQVTRHVETLRERFPGLPIAVVSHGNEQFALERERAEEYSPLHREVERLTGEGEVPVHVCGAYAQMHGVDEEDFPDYVDVAPSGPAQIRNYEELGYVRIRF